MSELFPAEMESERLRYEAITGETEALDLYEYTNEGAPHIEEVTEHLSWDPHATPKETAEFVSHVASQREEGQAGHYLLRPKEGEDGAGEFAGATSLHADWDRRLGVLGVWLRKRFWGRGYSGERAGRLLELAFERLDLDVVAVEHAAGNEQSRRAIEKYVEAHGGRHEGLLRYGGATQGGEPMDVHRYTVTAEEYAAATDE